MLSRRGLNVVHECSCKVDCGAEPRDWTPGDQCCTAAGVGMCASASSAFGQALKMPDSLHGTILEVE